MAKKKGLRAGGGLARPVIPSSDLAAIIGSAPLPRSQVVAKVWEHIRRNNLQNPKNKREILADDKLKRVFGGKDRVSMFEMSKYLSNSVKISTTHGSGGGREDSVKGPAHGSGGGRGKGPMGSTHGSGGGREA